VRVAAAAGARLRARREALGLSLAEASARTGVPIGQLISIEEGDKADAADYFRLVAFVDAPPRAPRPRNLGDALGRLIQQERERQGLSIEAVAARAELSVRWVREVERARTACDLPSLEALAREGLGLALSEVIEAAEHLLGRWQPSS
jgi:transcriptional regulator with XRE-family HTH domain